MPSGAWVRTGTEHTSVPAVTSRSALGGPWVTTCNGSRPTTLSTVYCQVPAHSGPSRAVTVADPLTRPLDRSTAITRSAPGWPLQLTAYASVNPLDWDGDGNGPGGSRPAGAGSDGEREGEAIGAALGSTTEEGTGVQPASAATATPTSAAFLVRPKCRPTNRTVRGHLIGTC
jgi:hypothetical protein